MTDLLSLSLRFEHDVVIARQRAREAARLLGFSTQDQTRIATVVSELARRAYRVGEQGAVDYSVDSAEDRRRFTIRIRHPGTDDAERDVRQLEEVLSGARRLLDHVEAGTADGMVTVTVGHRIPPSGPDPGEGRLERVVEELRDRNPNNPFEELQQQNEELVQAMAALREQERERSRLLEAEREAREEAQRAVKGREEILSIVSHDLRNPIGAIQTGARFLLDQPELLGSEGVGRKQLRAIVRSAERANRLIQDLLDLSSIDQGTLSVQTEPTEAGTVLDDLRELMGGRVEDAGVALETRAEDGLPGACADLDRVVQALGNLVSNAIRFTPEGGTIRVDVRRDGDALHFSVSDEGPGIPEADRDHLFDRYWTRDESGGGAGLGLAIVRGIVEGHGGRVWYDAETAPGASFHFTIPAAGPGCGGESQADREATVGAAGSEAAEGA